MIAFLILFLGFMLLLFLEVGIHKFKPQLDQIKVFTPYLNIGIVILLIILFAIL